MYNNNKVTMLIIGLLLVITIFGGCDQQAQIEPVSLDGRPMVAYMKMEEQTDERVFYSLKVSPFDGAPQSIAMKCGGLSAGANGDILGYGIKTEEGFNEDIYLLDRTGESRLVAEDIKFFELSKKEYSVLCMLSTRSHTFILKEYTPEGGLLREETIEGGKDFYFLEFNSNWDLILFDMLKNGDEDFDAGSRWKDIYIYQEGQMKKAAEKGIVSTYGQSISNDGTIVYISDGVSEELETVTGTLYRKEMDGEAEKLTEDSTKEFAISNDGSLVASILADENNNESFYYQYTGNEPVLVQNIIQFIMDRDGNTLYYTVGDKQNWQLELYRVSEREAPIMVADNAAHILDISADGKSVAYAANYDSEQEQAEIYIAREGEQTEFVDSGFTTFETRGYILTNEAKLYYDGSAIAYQKDRCDKYGQFWGLYIKEQGKEPVKIDDYVLYEFDFLK